jgi:hypothetical protein
MIRRDIPWLIWRLFSATLDNDFSGGFWTFVLAYLDGVLRSFDTAVYYATTNTAASSVDVKKRLEREDLWR